MAYEDDIELVENLVTEMSLEGKDTMFLENAVNAMSFVYALHDMYKESGDTVGDYPDPDRMQGIVDMVHGELAAACLFLSSPELKESPKLLRGIADAICAQDKSFEDEEGYTGPSVPNAVVSGFRNLASRIEVTQKQMELAGKLQSMLANQEDK